MLKSSRLWLRRVLPSDQPEWERWLTDSDVNRVLSSGSSMPRSPISLSDALAYWSADAADHVGFTIMSSDDVPIGAVQLADIDPWARHAELGIFIGDPACRGHGLGTEAMRLLLDFAFRQLNLHKVWLTVDADNDPAIRCYVRLGFRRDGVQRDAIYRDGRYLDRLLMSILESEFAPGDQETTEGR